MSPLKPKIFQLAKNHGWRAQPDHKIVVLDQGAVRIEYPESWILEVTDDCVRIRDKPPPKDDCVFGLSYHRWPALAAELTVATLVRQELSRDRRSFLEVGPIHLETHVDTSLAWGQGRYIHPGFGGRTSIKKVLPVVAGDLGYEGLAIGNGDDAMGSFGLMRVGKTSEADHPREREALLAYCRLDTLAMVRLHEELQRLRDRWVATQPARREEKAL